jgi:hypothetical protein
MKPGDRGRPTRKPPKKLPLAKWKGYCRGSVAKLVFASVEDLIAAVRGN